MDELEALSLAIEREKEAHRRYSEAAASSTDAKVMAWAGFGLVRRLDGSEQRT